MEQTSQKYQVFEKVKDIAGWLRPPAALRTIDILNWQDQQGYSGNYLEIGVYCGKYFTILVDRAVRNDKKALGIDTFQFAPKHRVKKELSKALGEQSLEHVNLLQAQSNAIKPDTARQMIGEPIFVSIDGAHDFENVYRDLILADALLASKGIIAVDDFLNPLALGVNQAVNLFFQQPRNVVPVAYISNKLFLAHASCDDEYRAAIEVMIEGGSDQQAENFRKMRKKDRSHIEQPFFGHMVLLS